MKKLIAASALALIPLLAGADMPRIELTAGMFRIDAEVAADQANRQRGLMQREQMRAHEGMLFVFPDKQRHCMWMRNTLLPLSVAFMDDDGRILNIEDMAPQTENNHCAAGPARFALEMNKGWFSQKGIAPGMRIGGVGKAPVPR